jgi:hypothetical protein
MLLTVTRLSSRTSEPDAQSLYGMKLLSKLSSNDDAVEGDFDGKCSTCSSKIDLLLFVQFKNTRSVFDHQVVYTRDKQRLVVTFSGKSESFICLYVRDYFLKVQKIY